MSTKGYLTEMDGTPNQIVFASSSFTGAVVDLRKGSPTSALLSLASVANAAFRQSAKVDLGVQRARRYAVRGSVEMAATPTALAVLSLYWAPSSSATAGTGNAANVSGADAAYTGYSSDGSTAVYQLFLIGTLVLAARATTIVQVGECGIFTPTERYGSLILLNSSGVAFHTSDVNTQFVLDPQTDLAA